MLKGLMQYFIWTGLWVPALGLNLILLLRWGTGDRYLPVRLFDYFTPWFFWFLFPLLLLALAGRCHYLALFLTIPTVYVLAAIAPHIPSASKAPVIPAEHSIKVLSHNIWSHNPIASRIASIVEKERPDLVLLQEVLPKHFAEINRQLQGSGFIYETVYDPDLLQAVFSRLPIQSHSSLKSLGQALKVIVTLPGGQSLAIFNIHPLRRGGWEHRHRKVHRLLCEEVSALQGPVIVAGDFNTTERTETYRLLRRHLQNAYERKGRGLGFTFPAPGTMKVAGIPLPPMIRIDHIFYNKCFVAISAKTLRDSGGSDHLPLIAELALKKVFFQNQLKPPENKRIGPDI